MRRHKRRQKKTYTPLRIDQLGPSDGGHKTPKEAIAESHQQLVLHYGENILDADITAELLREEDIPATAYSATAYSGGPKGKIYALLNGRPIARYDQKGLNTVAAFGLGEIYKSKVGGVNVAKLDPGEPS